MTTMRRVVGGRAAVQGFRPFFIGVAAEKSLNAGLRFLNAMGQFDEIVVGGDWMNEEAVRYFWRDIPGRASLPQIVVVRRSVKIGPPDDVGEEEVLARLIGTTEIERWLNSSPHF